LRFLQDVCQVRGEAIADIDHCMGPVEEGCAESVTRSGIEVALNGRIVAVTRSHTLETEGGAAELSADVHEVPRVCPGAADGLTRRDCAGHGNIDEDSIR